MTIPDSTSLPDSASSASSAHLVRSLLMQRRELYRRLQIEQYRVKLLRRRIEDTPTVCRHCWRPVAGRSEIFRSDDPFDPEE